MQALNVLRYSMWEVRVKHAEFFPQWGVLMRETSLPLKWNSLDTVFSSHRFIYLKYLTTKRSTQSPRKTAPPVETSCQIKCQQLNFSYINVFFSATEKQVSPSEMPAFICFLTFLNMVVSLTSLSAHILNYKGNTVIVTTGGLLAELTFSKEGCSEHA